jgi:ribose transport system ATP-binding protein
MTVLENVSLPVLKGYAPRGRLRHRAERNGVEALLREFEVTPPDGSRVLSELSGGNQQKALLAKWLQTAPRVLLLHEPTQGVDVGSKQEIFRRIEEAAQGGAAVLIASAEFEDLAHLCHRVLILRNGRIVNELSDEVMTSDRIADQAFRAEIADDAPPLLVGAKNG